jgi:DNA-binding response OmpR family regulator
VQLHDGEVSAESELGVGSTFTVRIPFGEVGLQKAGTYGAVSAEPYLVEASRWLEAESGDGGGRRDGTVMVVDDNPEMRRLLVRLLSPYWEVSEFPDGAKALEAARLSPPDVVLADVMMPNLDGFGLLRELRQEPATASTAVIFVSARAGEESSVEGFEAGADDYLVKPFALAELVLRLRALLRRSTPASGDAIRVGPLCVRPGERKVTVAGRPVELTRREFDLLEVLARNQGIVLSRSTLLERVWGYDFEVTDNAVDTFAGYLRRKLEAGGAPRMIHTVRGVGFVLRAAP